MIRGLRRSLRRLVARSRWLSKAWDRVHGLSVQGRPREERGISRLAPTCTTAPFASAAICPRWNGGRDASRAYRLRFNLEDRPRGRAAPVNISPDPDAEVVGVLYKITRKDLVWLDCTEGVAGRRYRQLCTEAEDRQGNRTACVTYIADGNATDGRPSLRYLTTLRGGTRAQELPGQWIRLLEDVKHAE